MLWFFQWNSFQWNVLYASINSDNLPVFYSQQLVQIQMLLINVVPFPMWFISFTFSLSPSLILSLSEQASSLSFSIFSLNRCSSPLSIAAYLHPHRLQLRVNIPQRESHIKSGYRYHLHLDLLVSTTCSVAARSGGLIFSDIVGGAAAIDKRGVDDKVPTQV